MPRLSNDLYYHRYEVLRWLWLNRVGIYSYISPKEQWAIHDYFQPSKQLSFQELVDHRRTVSRERPSLPATAGRAANQIWQLIEGQRAPRPFAQSEQRGSRQRQVTVRAVVRPEIDIEKLAKTLLELAKLQAKDKEPPTAMR